MDRYENNGDEYVHASSGGQTYDKCELQSCVRSFVSQMTETRTRISFSHVETFCSFAHSPYPSGNQLIDKNRFQWMISHFSTVCHQSESLCGCVCVCVCVSLLWLTVLSFKKIN